MSDATVDTGVAVVLALAALAASFVPTLKAMRIDPDHATIQGDCIFSRTCTPWDPLYYAKGPRWSIANSTYRRRFTEYAIPLQADLYILGNAKLRDGWFRSASTFLGGSFGRAPWRRTPGFTIRLARRLGRSRPGRGKGALARS